MTEEKKRSMADLIRRTEPVTPGMRMAKNLAFHESIIKMKEDFERAKVSLEWQAMDKLEAELRNLRADPAINVSEPCRDLLDLVTDLLNQAWPNHDVQRIVAPMQKHFDNVKAKDASGKKKEIGQVARDMHYRFLDRQNDISDTARLAVRLRKEFSLESERGTKDTVRAWKRLRASGKA